VADAQGVLGQIAAHKRRELADRFRDVSLDALRARATRTTRSLAAALAKPGARFILEIKKASPSGGAIRPTADPAAIARGYAGVADALSVLTDANHFGGSLGDLALARHHFDGPILAKDFFMDPRQVVEARIAGADAVLVMLSLLDDARVRDIIAEARRHGMDALVEVHDEAEMCRALALGAPLIGVNNRDLRDLSVDLSATERLAPMAPDRLLVSESGISTRADVERLSPQVDAFLVGSSLMRSSDPAQAARELVFGRTKLCGLNCGADIRAARPAAFAGFVFVPGSPRHVTADEAAPLAGTARKSGMLPVGVFRDAPLSVVTDIATLLNLHAVQLHGHEDVEYVRALRRELPETCEIWTALSVGREALTNRGGDRLVFDNAEGGSGRTFDWALLKGHPSLRRAIVAGGIGPHNAGAAQRLGAYAIDVGSLLDCRPGQKSPEKIAAFFESLRPASRQRLRECA
jgi:indole-3-glycerol phosphate synthase/phosphoribosylanthranilate isomerase